MAQSSVAITAGTGTPIDVFTTATQHNNRQSIVVADPSLDAGAAGVTNSAPGASDYALEVRQIGLPAAATLADNTSNPTLSQIQTFPSLFDGVDWDRMPGDATNGVFTNIKSSIALTVKVQDGSGNAITSTGSALDINLKTSSITVTVAGGLTNNNAAPGANNVGVLSALANAGQPSNTEGNFVLVSVDLKGNLRTKIMSADGKNQGMNIDYQGRAIGVQSGDVVSVSGNVLLAPQRQPINITPALPSLSVPVVSGYAGHKIRVLNGLLMTATATTIQFKSNNNSDVTGPLPIGANGGFQIPEAEIGDFETQVGEPLTILASAANQIGGWLTYVIV